MKIFIVMERWEFEGAEPVEAFHVKEDAETEANRLNEAPSMKQRLGGHWFAVEEVVLR